MPFWPAFIVWSITGLGAFFLSSRASWLVLVSPVVAQCLVFGQTALLLAAILMAAAKTKGLARGALVGIVFVIKPQLVVLAPLVFVVRLDWRGALGFAAASISLVVLSVALFGVDLWREWFQAVVGFRNTLSQQDLWGVVVTPFSYAVQLGLNPWPIFAISFALAVAAICIVRTGNPIELICLTCFLASPYAGGSDLATVLPFAFRRLTDPKEPLKIWAALIYSAALVPVATALGLYRLVRMRSAKLESPTRRNRGNSVTKSAL
jgi:hypothetical protein